MAEPPERLAEVLRTLEPLAEAACSPAQRLLNIPASLALLASLVMPPGERACAERAAGRSARQERAAATDVAPPPSSAGAAAPFTTAQHNAFARLQARRSPGPRSSARAST